MSELSEIEDLLDSILSGVPTKGPPKPVGTPMPTVSSLPPVPGGPALTTPVKKVLNIPPVAMEVIDEAAPIPPEVWDGLAVPAQVESQVSHAPVTGVMSAPVAKPAPAPSPSTPVLQVPKFTPAELNEAFDIRNFGTLVTLNTTRWHAKVKDRKAAKQTELANDTQAGSVDAYKHLFPKQSSKGPGSLQKVYRALDAARTEHYALTLPWTVTGIEDDGRRRGSRLLPNEKFFDYVTAMANHKKAMEQALREFVPEYPTMIEAAKPRLGRLFNEDDFPPVDQIEKRFALDFDFTPVAAGNDFKGLPAAQLGKLAEAVNAKTKKMVDNAMEDLWTRLHDCMAHVAERLGSPDKTFHASLVDNVRELVAVLGPLNITGDTRIDYARDYISREIVPHDADKLRDDVKLRARVAKAAEAMLVFMGQTGSTPT